MSRGNAVTRYRLSNADLVSDYFALNENRSFFCSNNSHRQPGLLREQNRWRGGAAAARPSSHMDPGTGGGQREEAKADVEAGRNWRPERETKRTSDWPRPGPLRSVTVCANDALAIQTGLSIPACSAQ
jgi:hypothetical protein